MALRSWVLLDAEHGIDLPPQRWSARQLGVAEPMWVESRIWSGGLQQGVREIRLSNGTATVSVLPTRGMGIWKVWVGEREIGWRSPVRGPVHPAFVPLAEPSGLGWLDGFDELVARCGLESNGAPEFDAMGRLRYPLHGRIANRPAHRVVLAVDEQNGELILSGEVDECRFHFLKLRLHAELRIGPVESGFRLVDRIENLSANPAEAQLLYHINIGVPLLDAGSRIVAPARTVVPRNHRAAEGIASWDSYRGEAAGFEEQVYFLELFGDRDSRSRVLLKNAHATAAVGIEFRLDQLPCFTIWKNTTAVADGYVTGLEPGTNYPNPRSFEGKHGRVVRLAGGESTRFELALHYYGSEQAVAEAEQAVLRLREAPPQVLPTPVPDKCAP